jgi:hypothetical protein
VRKTKSFTLVEYYQKQKTFFVALADSISNPSKQ